MKIIFTDADKNTLLVFNDDESISLISYPPIRESDKKLVEDYGGLYAIEKSWVQYHRDQEEFFARAEKQANQQITFTSSFAIDAMIKEELTKPEMMKIKMSIFAKPEVKKSKNRELLTGLRKATDIVDVMKYYGLIRDDNNSK